MLKPLGYVGFISILAAKDVSRSELKADLKKRLKSKLFSVEKISILEYEEDESAPSPPTKRKQTA